MSDESRRLIERLELAPHPEGVIGAGMWQAARSLGAYSLVGCSVGPGFEFRGFQFVSSLPDHRHDFEGPLQPFASLL